MVRILSLALSAAALTSSALSARPPVLAREFADDTVNFLFPRAATSVSTADAPFPTDVTCASEYGQKYAGSDIAVSTSFLQDCSTRLKQSGNGQSAESCDAYTGVGEILCYDQTNGIAVLAINRATTKGKSSSYCFDVAAGVDGMMKWCGRSKYQGNAVAGGNGDIGIFVLPMDGIISSNGIIVTTPAGVLTSILVSKIQYYVGADSNLAAAAKPAASGPVSKAAASTS